METICSLFSTSKKALKKKQFHPEKRGKWHLRDSTFQKFPGGACPQTPLRPSYAARRADECPAARRPPQKKFSGPVSL